MNSPSKDTASSNSVLDYAPPWVRDRMRPAPQPVEKRAQGEVLRENRLYPDNRAWHQRALDPELVPEPPPGAANFWSTILRMGIVCAIAAFVAAAVVLLFDPKQNTHKVAQADATPPGASGSPAFQSADGARVLPALTAESSAASASLAREPPQMPPTQSSPPAQVADTDPQATAPIPAQNPSLGNLAAAPSPAMSKPPTQLTETGSLASNAPQQAASLAEPQPPSSPVAKQPFPKQPAALDDNEISALIKRGNSLLEEGDFAAARVLFEHAANAGSAEAALALGSTYDLLAIKRLGAIGVKARENGTNRCGSWLGRRDVAARQFTVKSLKTALGLDLPDQH